MPVCLCYGVLWNRPTHYDVIASRDYHTATRKHYTTARRSREKARGTDAALLYVHPHLTDLLPAPSTGCGRPARFMLHMLISTSLRRRDDRHYWWSQRVICRCRANYATTLACPLQSANAFSLWVLSRQVWMQLQLEHRFWKNITGARFWKRVPDNRILLNNLNLFYSNLNFDGIKNFVHAAAASKLCPLNPGP